MAAAHLTLDRDTGHATHGHATNRHAANGHAPPGMHTPLQVFIVGGPRSGTSVLTRAMQLVFGLPGHGESHTIPAAATATYPLRRYLERFRGNQQDVLIKTLAADRIENLLFDFLRGFYAHTYGGQSWVDKTPSDEAVHSIALIPRIFPDARIIVTRRNGIEVVRSARAKFGVAFADACQNWASVMAGVELARERCPQALEIDHRQMVHDTDAVAAACARHLGRPDLAAPLATFLRTDKQDQLWATPGPRATTLGDTNWSEDEKATFRRLCGPWMDLFGYAMDPAPGPQPATRDQRSPKARPNAAGKRRAQGAAL